MYPPPPQAIQDVDEFVPSAGLKKCFALYHLLTYDPLQWMGAVGMEVQTADKTITKSTSNQQDY